MLRLAQRSRGRTQSPAEDVTGQGERKQIKFPIQTSQYVHIKGGRPRDAKYVGRALGIISVAVAAQHMSQGDEQSSLSSVGYHNAATAPEAEATHRLRAENSRSRHRSAPISKLALDGRLGEQAPARTRGRPPHCGHMSDSNRGCQHSWGSI